MTRRILIVTPVIRPPDPEVVQSWTHPDHLIVVNGAYREWANILEESWRTRADGGFYSYVEFQPDDQPVARNLGVSASWNYAFHRATEEGYDYVAILSQNLLLHGGTRWLTTCVERLADHRGLITDHAWRTITLHTDIWNELGPFDIRFTPGYWEDTDYMRRLYLAGHHTPTNQIPRADTNNLPATLVREAGTLTSGLIPHSVYGESHGKYLAKWGGEAMCETFTRPDDPTSYDPTRNWSHDAATVD